jgi:hypothetical protein
LLLALFANIRLGWKASHGQNFDFSSPFASNVRVRIQNETALYVDFYSSEEANISLFSPKVIWEEKVLYHWPPRWSRNRRKGKFHSGFGLCRYLQKVKKIKLKIYRRL